MTDKETNSKKRAEGSRVNKKELLIGLILGMAVGAVIGAIIGAVIGDVVLGVWMGMAVGTPIVYAIYISTKKK